MKCGILVYRSHHCHVLPQTSGLCVGVIAFKFTLHLLSFKLICQYSVFQKLHFSGVNSPDHSIMFHNLRTLLQEKVTPFAAELHSKDCVNIKSTVSKAVAQLMGTSYAVSRKGAREFAKAIRVNTLVLIEK